MRININLIIIFKLIINFYYGFINKLIKITLSTYIKLDVIPSINL